MVSRRHFAVVALLVAALGGASSCGTSNRDIGEGAIQGGLVQKASDPGCIGDLFKSSGASNKALRAIAAIADSDSPGGSFTFSKKDSEALGPAMAKAEKTC